MASVAGCSKDPSNEQPPLSVTDTSALNSANFEAPPADAASDRATAVQGAGPNIGPESAPDVAFNYRYDFRLDAVRVAEAQQEHQRLCERLTLERCRITGMSYRAANDRDVEAMLSFSIDPAAAAQFGRESVQAVINAEGELAGSEITGTDVGSPLRSSGRTLAALNAQLQRLETRIRGLGEADKGQLELEAQALRQQIAEIQQRRAGQAEALALTPMLFRYGSGNLTPGPAQPPSLSDTVEDTSEDFMAGMTMLLAVLIRLLPWGVVALLVFGVIRYLRRRFLPKAPTAAVEPAVEG
jgi:hypothetical protein